MLPYFHLDFDDLITQLNFWFLKINHATTFGWNVAMKYFEFRLPAVQLAGLGIMSGILCTYMPSTITDITVFEVPVIQGIIFGMVIAFGLIRWGNAGWIGSIIAVIFTVLAWIAAVRSFQFITNDASSNLYLGALAAGGIGTAGTLAGGALTTPDLRKPTAWLSTIFVGALAGLLVVPVVHSSDEKFLLLFVVWQSAIAFCFGHDISRSKPDEK